MKMTLPPLMTLIRLVFALVLFCFGNSGYTQTARKLQSESKLKADSIRKARMIMQSDSIVNAKARLKARTKPEFDSTLTADSILIEGHFRSFHYKKPVHLNPGGNLLFLMHGSGGTGIGMAKGTARLEAIAPKEKLLIVYPDGYLNYWNECRRFSTAVANTEDVNEQAFFQAMINYCDSIYKIDRSKVFAAGMSGGGHMAYKLGLTMPGTIHAIAAIIANLPDAASMDCVASGKPLPVMIVNGTADSTNPYNGGAMFVNKASFGVVQSTEQSFKYWSALAGYKGDPLKQLLPDRNLKDGQNIEIYTFRKKGKPEVTLLKVIGGHHSYPSDIDVFLYIWDFFKRSMAGKQ